MFDDILLEEGSAEVIDYKGSYLLTTGAEWYAA